MKSKRRKFSAQFKAKVAVEALKERESLSELSRRFEVHPNMISNRVGGRWKNEILDNSSTIFEKERSTEDEVIPDPEKLYAKIGKLELENDFLKKRRGPPP
jgi:transposase-like protein